MPGKVLLSTYFRTSFPPVLAKLALTIELTSDFVHAVGFGSAQSCSARVIQLSQLSLPAKGTPKSTGWKI